MLLFRRSKAAVRTQATQWRVSARSHVLRRMNTLATSPRRDHAMNREVKTHGAGCWSSGLAWVKRWLDADIVRSRRLTTSEAVKVLACPGC